MPGVGIYGDQRRLRDTVDLVLGGDVGVDDSATIVSECNSTGDTLLDIGPGLIPAGSISIHVMLRLDRASIDVYL